MKTFSRSLTTSDMSFPTPTPLLDENWLIFNAIKKLTALPKKIKTLETT